MGKSKSSKLSFLNSVYLFMILFGFWFILSGKTDAFHLIMGLASTLFVTLVSRSLFVFSSPAGFQLNSMAIFVLVGRLFRYILWLMGEIIIANFQVAYLVLHPKMPISPRIVSFRKKFSHEVADLALANSITLTPGTITLDVEKDQFIIHAISKEAAHGLMSRDSLKNGMSAKVEGIFE